jgi:group II intron reverse transcriptase/maturase
VELIETILSDENLNEAIRRVEKNHGAAGVDGMKTDELEEYFANHKEEIRQQIRNMQYRPKPVRRVYIPKPNGKQRPLGIPTVADRVIQQAVAQVLSGIFDSTFSDHSYGFRPGRSAQDAMAEALNNLNSGYDWVIDLDIEKYFDTVNHDKLISVLREKVNDRRTLHLIRSFLKAGVMENGLESPTESGVPQGGSLSPVLSNVYLDKFDKELESRGLHFVRYADDCDIFVKSEMAADRVMKSVTSWLERKLFLKVSPTKTKVVRPSDSEFLGFSYWKAKDGWHCKPSNERKKRLYAKTKKVLKRKQAVSSPLESTFTKLNQIMRGWINYFSIGDMRSFLTQYGQWMRHKVRVVIIKQWKVPARINKNLQALNRRFRCGFTDEDTFKVANSRLGWYRRCGMDVVNYALSPKALAVPNRKTGRPGLVNPLDYYLEHRK